MEWIQKHAEVTEIPEDTHIEDIEEIEIKTVLILATNTEFVEKSLLEEMQAKADDNYQRFLRAQADFDNFRRRTRTEKAEAPNLLQQV